MTSRTLTRSALVPKPAPPPPPLPAVMPVSAEWQADYNNILRRVSYFMGLIFIFLKFSYGHEVAAYMSGRNLYLLLLVAPPAMGAALFSGAVRRTIRQRAAVYWLFFAVWLAIGWPFSFWPGGSLSSALYYLRFEFPILFILGGSIMTWPECRRAILLIAGAAAFDIVFGLTHRDASTPRLDLGFGTMGNANDFAAHLLLIAPLLIWVFQRSGSGKAVRMGSLALTAVGLYLIMRTGSRGAIVAIAVMTMFYLYKASMKQRVLALVVLPVAAVAVLTILPGEILDRLKSFSSSKQDGTSEAIESKQAREHLLRQSIRYSLESPIFGVGMGQFSPYEDSRSRKETSRKGQWHETHNAYTQVSSECGIVALGFYLAALFSTFGLLARTWRQAQAFGHTDISSAIMWITVGMVAFCVAIFFLALGYRFYLPAMTGLAIAIHTSAQHEFALMRHQAAVRAQMAPA